MQCLLIIPTKMRTSLSSESHRAELPAFTDVLQTVSLSAFLGICRINSFERNHLLSLLSQWSASPCFSKKACIYPLYAKDRAGRASALPILTLQLVLHLLPSQGRGGGSTWVSLKLQSNDKNLQAPFAFSQPYLAQTRMKSSSWE